MTIKTCERPNFASTYDVEDLWRTLTPGEEERAESLLTVISDTLRFEASKVNQDLDLKVKESPIFANVLKSVVVDIVSRTLSQSTNDEAMTDTTQTALGYSWSGSYLVPGGGLYIKKSELKRLGLKTQKLGVIELYG